MSRTRIPSHHRQQLERKISETVIDLEPATTARKSVALLTRIRIRLQHLNHQNLALALAFAMALALAFRSDCFAFFSEALRVESKDFLFLVAKVFQIFFSESGNTFHCFASLEITCVGVNSGCSFVNFFLCLHEYKRYGLVNFNFLVINDI